VFIFLYRVLLSLALLLSHLQHITVPSPFSPRPVSMNITYTSSAAVYALSPGLARLLHLLLSSEDSRPSNPGKISMAFSEARQTGCMAFYDEARTALQTSSTMFYALQSAALAILFIPFDCPMNTMHLEEQPTRHCKHEQQMRASSEHKPRGRRDYSALHTAHAFCTILY
jgi:hypothetical protein